MCPDRPSQQEAPWKTRVRREQIDEFITEPFHIKEARLFRWDVPRPLPPVPSAETGSLSENMFCPCHPNWVWPSLFGRGFGSAVLAHLPYSPKAHDTQLKKGGERQLKWWQRARESKWRTDSTLLKSLMFKNKLLLKSTTYCCK